MNTHCTQYNSETHLNLSDMSSSHFLGIMYIKIYAQKTIDLQPRPTTPSNTRTRRPASHSSIQCVKLVERTNISCLHKRAVATSIPQPVRRSGYNNKTHDARTNKHTHKTCNYSPLVLFLTMHGTKYDGMCKQNMRHLNGTIIYRRGRLHFGQQISFVVYMSVLRRDGRTVIQKVERLQSLAMLGL